MAGKKIQTQSKELAKAKRIEQLLTMAWNTTSRARILAITSQILELDPDNIEAMVLKADRIENPEKRLEILEHAFNVLNSVEHLKHELRIMYRIALLQRLSYVCYGFGRHNKAFEYCNEAITFSEENFDPEEDENYISMKSMRYRLLIEKKQWQTILAYSMKDEDRTPGWAYSRLIAAWVLSPKNKRQLSCAKLFWDALLTGTDIPFYMLGFFEEPDYDDDEETREEFDFSIMYYDVLSVTDDFYNWFSRGVVLFGLLTNRFEGKERDYMIDALDSLGGFHDYEKMSKILVEGDDMSVIEAMAANKCLLD